MDNELSKFEEKAKKLESGAHNTKRRAPVYWIWCIRNGRLVVVGYRTSEEEAYQWGYEKLPDIDFKVNMLPTIDTNEAVRRIKGELLDKTANLDMSLQRARRKV